MSKHNNHFYFKTRPFYIFSLLFILLSLSLQSFAQPANDNCANAITVIPQPYSTTCNATVSASTVGATRSFNTPFCISNNVQVPNDDDIWYKFTATDRTAIIRFSDILFSTNIPTSIGMAVYDIPCPDDGENEMICIASVANGSGIYHLENLTVGKQYLLRFWSQSTTLPVTLKFCLQNIGAAPTNDDRENAILFDVQPFGQNIEGTVLVNTFGATLSEQPGPNCGGPDGYDDVWYKFIATSTQHIFQPFDINPILGNVSFIGMNVYNGGKPDTATGNFGPSAIIDCVTGINDVHTVSNFIPGNIYYIRLWTTFSWNYGTFKFGIMEVPTPPVNDNCNNAVTLIPQPINNACTNPFKANTTGATYSTPGILCGQKNHNDDIWFKFTATSTQHYLSFSNIQATFGEVNFLKFNLYDAGSGGNPICPTANSGNILTACGIPTGNSPGYMVPNLIIGNNYYLRVWSDGMANFCSFDICILQLPPAPANDECSNAVTLTPVPYKSTSGLSVSTAGATPSPIQEESCVNEFANDDIWYKFTATRTTHIIRYSSIKEEIGGTLALGMAIYDAQNEAFLNCLEPGNPIFCEHELGNQEKGGTILNGLVVGNTYYIRLWTWDIQNAASFKFFLENPPAAPANDDCAGAITIQPSSYNPLCSNLINVSTIGATQSVAPPDICSDKPKKLDIWYKFTANTNQYIFQVSNLQWEINRNLVATFEIYDAGTNPAANCSSSLTPGQCITVPSEKIIVRNFIPGNIYFLRIHTSVGYPFDPGNYGTFDFCLQALPQPANDECINAIPITLQTSAAQCVDPIQVETIGATKSTPAVTCMQSAYNEGDVWYTFTATATRVRFVFNQIQPTLNNSSSVGMALYVGNCPTGAVASFCRSFIATNNGTNLLSGFTIGTTYYLRLWSEGFNTASSFLFCAQAVPAPVNDECAGALALNVGKGFGTHPATANLMEATVSPGSVAAVCRTNSRVSDLWFSTIVPATGNVVIETSPADSTVVDVVMEAYTGNCGVLSFLTCNDNGNPEALIANHSRIVLTNRTPGEKITLRVVAANIASLGRFNIYAFDSSSSQLPEIVTQGNCDIQDTIIISAANGNGYRWLPVFNQNGQVIGEIFPNGNYRDSIFSKVFVNGSSTQRQMNGKYYADRNISLAHTKGNFHGKVRLYVKDNEIMALAGVDNSVVNAASLQILADTTICSDQLQTITYAYPLQAASYGKDYFLQYAPNRLSQFFITAQCQPTLTWTGQQNSNWHNPNNWSCATIPGPEAIILIPAGTPHQPVISAAVEIKGLQLQKNASLTVTPGIHLKITGQ